MKRPLRLLVKADCKPHIQIYEELAAALREVVEGFEMRAVSCDRYRGLGVGESWQQLGIQVYDMPRPTGTLSMWQGGGADVGTYFPLVMREFDRVLAGFQPDIFLFPVDVGMHEIGFIRRCAVRGVPTLLMQEGLGIGDGGEDGCLLPRIRPGASGWLVLARHRYRQFRWWLRHRLGRETLPEERPFCMNGADYVATIGPHYTRLLVRRGLAQSRLSTTGLPRFDRLWRLAKSHGRWPGGVFPWKSPRPRVVFLQTRGFHYGSDQETIRQDLQPVDDVASRLGDRVEVVVRLRPEEQVVNYEAWWAETFKATTYSSGQEDLYDALLGCEVAIAHRGTTTQLEAMVLGIPVVHYNQFRTDPFSFVSSGATVPAHDAGTLAVALDQILAGGEVARRLAEGRQKYLAERVLIDGGAGRRAAEFIVRIVRGWQGVEGRSGYANDCADYRGKDAPLQGAR